MKKITQLLLFGVLIFFTSLSSSREIALTFDDAPLPDSILMSGEERTQRLITELQNSKVNDVLFFVTTSNIDESGKVRLQQYIDAGFHLSNHSHSHLSANSMSSQEYATDIKKAQSILENYQHLQPYHRFPFLHYGNDLSSIHELQSLMSAMGYQDGYVTIDNFDWYINALLLKAADENKTIDYAKASQLYVSVLYENIEFYDAIAQKSLGRSPKHILLLHENDAAALFVGDLILHLRNKGWTIITPQDAYQDPIAKDFPNVTFHKQGRVAAIARSQGVAEKQLRHPSENTEYLDKRFQLSGIATSPQRSETLHPE